MRNLNQISGDDVRQIYCFTLTILTNTKFTSGQNCEGIALPQELHHDVFTKILM